MAKYNFANQEEYREFLVQCAEMYYNTGGRTISDSVFDQLKDAYENKYGEQFQVGAKVTVGTTLSLSHGYDNFAGTLFKCKTIQDIVKWAKNKDIPLYNFGGSVKQDGFSITCEIKYKNGKYILDKALSRGKDGVGKDLTQVFRKNFHKVFVPDVQDDLAIGYEATVTYTDFDIINESNILGKKYKTPRSVIAGLTSESGAEHFKYVTLLPLRMQCKNIHIDRIDQYEIFNEYYESIGRKEFFKVFKDLNELKKFYLDMQTDRLQLENLVDGLVIETLDEDLREELGFTSTEPNFATALKFPALEKETTAIKVEWSSEGFSSRQTPVIHFSPVNVAGAEYTKVSLANYARFKSLVLREGDDVLFSLQNDTLGYIEKLHTEHNNSNNGKLFSHPTTCPECDEPLLITDDTVFLECNSYTCPLNLIGNLMKFVDVMGLKFLGRSTVRALFDNGILQYPSDFIKAYKFNKTITDIEGIGDGTVALLKKVSTTLTTQAFKDYRVLAALNIHLCDVGRWKTIFRSITFDTLCDYLALERSDFVTKLSMISDIGAGVATAIWDYFDNDKNTEEMLKILDNITIESSTIRVDTDFKCFTFVHTGSASPFKKRNDIVSYIESKGHKVTGKVTSKTQYLINNDITSTTGKNNDAKTLNVPIISVQELKDLLG